ncbi:MAG: hypothetical protein K2X77_05925 [Candidatus Obscuribacterales bacterium]|jgi:TolA-binding protein|nr:hypothetical protein [Candidatus Obscuribacterales bacterium]
MNMQIVKGITLAVLCASFLAVADAQADCNKGRVNCRQNRQGKRINQGVNNGSLTGRETARLARQQAQLRRQERRMRASGDGLTATERMRIEHNQDQMSQSIYNQKHDQQTR